MSLIDRIKQRMFELMIVSDMSRAEAIKKAATEFGRVEAIKDNSGAVPIKPQVADGDGANNAREQLFSRIMSMRERMFGAKGAEPQAASGIETGASGLPDPTPTPKTLLGRL